MLYDITCALEFVGDSSMISNNKRKIRWYHAVIMIDPLSSLCSLAKATFSITTEAIVNELSVEGKLIYYFIYPILFLERVLNIVLEISADA